MKPEPLLILLFGLILLVVIIFVVGHSYPEYLIHYIEHKEELKAEDEFCIENGYNRSIRANEFWCERTVDGVIYLRKWVMVYGNRTLREVEPFECSPHGCEVVYETQPQSHSPPATFW